MIEVKISANNSELKKGLQDVEKQSKKTFSKMETNARTGIGVFSKLTQGAKGFGQALQNGLAKGVGLLAKLGPLGSLAATGILAVGGAAVGAVKALTSWADRLDNIAKSSKSVNLSANAYLGLQYASRHAGIEMEKVLDLIKKVDVAVVKASDGQKQYVDAFHALGLSFSNLEKMSPEKRLFAINTAIKQLNDEGKRLPSGLFDIFSRKDLGTLNLMQHTDYEKLAAQAGAFGLKIDARALRAAEDFKDTLGDSADYMKSMLDNMVLFAESAEKASKFLKEHGPKPNADGKVAKEASDKWEGIGDIAERYVKNRNFDIDTARAILRAQYSEQAYDPLTGTSTTIDKSNASTMSEEAVYRKVASLLRTKGIKGLRGGARDLLFKATASLDSRFNASDESTWVQQKNETLSYAEKRQGIINDLLRIENKTLEKEIASYENLNTQKSKNLSTAERIKTLEEQIGKAIGEENFKLDEKTKKELEIADIKRKQLEQTLKISKATEDLNKSSADLKLDNNLKAAMAKGDIGAIKEAQTERFLAKYNLDKSALSNPMLKSSLDAYQKEQDRQSRIGFNTNLKDQYQKLQIDALKASGQTLQAAKLENRSSLEASLGRPLSKDQVAKIDQLTQYQEMLSTLGQARSVKNDVIQTNDLARRGGFTSSVVYQKNSETASLKIQTEIKRILEQSRICQEKTLSVLGS